MIITVETEEERQQLIEALRHIHDSDIDTDIPMVNELAHMYNAKEKILVNLDGTKTMTKNEWTEIMHRTILSGNPSEEYEAGYWDCYTIIFENFMKYFWEKDNDND